MKKLLNKTMKLLVVAALIVTTISAPIAKAHLNAPLGLVNDVAVIEEPRVCPLIELVANHARVALFERYSGDIRDVLLDWHNVSVGIENFDYSMINIGIFRFNADLAFANCQELADALNNGEGGQWLIEFSLPSEFNVEPVVTILTVIANRPGDNIGFVYCSDNFHFESRPTQDWWDNTTVSVIVDENGETEVIVDSCLDVDYEIVTDDNGRISVMLPPELESGNIAVEYPDDMTHYQSRDDENVILDFVPNVPMTCPQGYRLNEDDVCEEYSEDTFPDLIPEIDLPIMPPSGEESGLCYTLTLMYIRLYYLWVNENEIDSVRNLSEYIDFYEILENSPFYGIPAPEGYILFRFASFPTLNLNSNHIPNPIATRVIALDVVTFEDCDPVAEMPEMNVCPSGYRFNDDGECEEYSDLTFPDLNPDTDMPVADGIIIIDVENDRSTEVSNTPDYEIEGDEEYNIGDVIVTFPPGTDRDNIVVNLPDPDWSYTIEEDEDGYVVVTITPPLINPTPDWPIADGVIIIDVESDRSTDVNNAPDYTVERDEDYKLGDIIVTFPPGTDRDNIIVNLPESDWGYTIEEDEGGSVVVIITPPEANPDSTIPALPEIDLEIVIDVDSCDQIDVNGDPNNPNLDYVVNNDNCNEILVIFPPYTDEDDIVVNLPDVDWDYRFERDEDGNLIVVITPPEASETCPVGEFMNEDGYCESEDTFYDFDPEDMTPDFPVMIPETPVVDDESDETFYGVEPEGVTPELDVIIPETTPEAIPPQHEYPRVSIRLPQTGVSVAQTGYLIALASTLAGSTIAVKKIKFKK